MRTPALLLLVASLTAGCAERITSSPGTPVVIPSHVLALPLSEPERYYQTVGIDHDGRDAGGGVSGATACEDFDGRPFPWCYDGHDGTDYLLSDGWESLDNGSTAVLAASDGVVVDLDDGHYDRCHLSIELGDVDCDGNDGLPNFVEIDHGNGLTTEYFHLKNGSVAVRIGDQVRCGDAIGLVGSSGYSSFPHLHFQASHRGRRIDPYAGSNNPIESLWVAQNGGSELPSSDCP